MTAEGLGVVLPSDFDSDDCLVKVPAPDQFSVSFIERSGFCLPEGMT